MKTSHKQDHSNAKKMTANENLMTIQKPAIFKVLKTEGKITQIWKPANMRYKISQAEW